MYKSIFTQIVTQISMVSSLWGLVGMVRAWFASLQYICSRIYHSCLFKSHLGWLHLQYFSQNNFAFWIRHHSFHYWCVFYVLCRWGFYCFLHWWFVTPWGIFGALYLSIGQRVRRKFQYKCMAVWFAYLRCSLFMLSVYRR